MSADLEADYVPLLAASAFASRAHAGQKRKDGRTPYVSHAFRVCLILRHVFGIDDTPALTTALLHDTLEDTTVDFDELRLEFGEDVARGVATLSKDTRLPETEREAAYVRQLETAAWQVKVCKLADVFDNLMDLGQLSASQRRRAFQNAHRYLAAVKNDLPSAANHAWQMVKGLLDRLEAKDGSQRT